jgi:XRE family transcriptional regulator, fatty acid utilization regulator
MQLLDGENLRIVLGIKLKQLRTEKKLSLKDLSEQTELSISYLSEIEKGKKYPKPEKIMALARALDTSFDELVTLKVDESLDPLAAVLNSAAMREFPFQLFGIEPQGIMELFAHSPAKAGALLRTFTEILHGYDMRVEQFMLSALRSFQKMHLNYFEDLEEAAEAFIAEEKWKYRIPAPTEQFAKTLQSKYAYEIDESTLGEYWELQKFRSVLLNSGPHAHTPRLLLNTKLVPRQKAFIYGRELGYNYLNLVERALTSSWVKVESFDQVLNNFKASYFSGALLMPRDAVVKDLTKLFQKKQWDSALLLSSMEKYDVTPEMFIYRMTELLPKFLGLSELHFMRVSHDLSSGTLKMTKFLNLSQDFMPYGLELNEHYCRRWLPIAVLKREQQKISAHGPHKPVVALQRAFFVESQQEYFVITLARPFALQPSYHSSVSIGFLMNAAFKETVRFWNDPAIERINVNETCERCGLSAAHCRDRVAEADVYEKALRQRQREKILARLIGTGIQKRRPGKSGKSGKSEKPGTVAKPQQQGKSIAKTDQPTQTIVKNETDAIK